MFRGKEIVGTISQQRLIHLHERSCSDWMTWPHGSPAPQPQTGEQALVHLTSNQSHWACTRKEKEEGQKNTLFTANSAFFSAIDIPRGITFRLKTTFVWVFHEAVLTLAVSAQRSSCTSTLLRNLSCREDCCQHLCRLRRGSPKPTWTPPSPPASFPWAPSAPLLISESPFPQSIEVSTELQELSLVLFLSQSKACLHTDSLSHLFLTLPSACTLTMQGFYLSEFSFLRKVEHKTRFHWFSLL